MRDFEGFCDTRHKLLLYNGGRRGSWVGYGIACHLLNDYDTALQVMSTCRHTEGDPARPDPEASEVGSILLISYLRCPWNVSRHFRFKPFWVGKPYKFGVFTINRKSHLNDAGVYAN